MMGTRLGPAVVGFGVVGEGFDDGGAASALMDAGKSTLSGDVAGGGGAVVGAASVGGSRWWWDQA